MNETAGIALLYLMFGQFLILSFGILILWWMSEPGTKWTQSRAQRRAQAGSTAHAAPEASVQPAVGTEVLGLQPKACLQPSAGETLLALRRDHAAEPDRPDDDRTAAPSRDHAVQA